jgi:PQQ-dependent catabolism-associated CXXCW motif protein
MDVRAVGVIVLGALVLASGTAPGENLLTVEPESYRSENYRSPTPATLRGARVITTPEAQNLWIEGSAAFIDVLPNFPPPPDLPAGTLWRGQQRFNIPGSTWLPDTGYGELSEGKGQSRAFAATGACADYARPDLGGSSLSVSGGRKATCGPRSG